MDQQVKAVLDGFRNLSDRQQVKAWIEIEAIWKAPPGKTPRKPLPAKPSSLPGDIGA